MKIDEGTLKVANEFVYLDVVIGINGGCEEDMEKCGARKKG